MDISIYISDGNISGFIRILNYKNLGYMPEISERTIGMPMIGFMRKYLSVLLDPVFDSQSQAKFISSVVRLIHWVKPFSVIFTLTNKAVYA